MIKQCDKCNHEDRQKKLKRVNREWLCKSCYKNKRKERRKFIKRKILGITQEQEQLEKEIIKKNSVKKSHYDKCRCGNSKIKTSKTCQDCYIRKLKQKREQKEREKLKKKSESPPKIKGQKNRQKSKNLHMYLTKNELHFLYKKYNGDSEKVNKIKKHLSQLVKKLREEKKTDKEINSRFKEEFSKLISE